MKERYKRMKKDEKLLLSDEEHEELKKEVMECFVVTAAETIGACFGLLGGLFILSRLKKKK
jgi:hypothetical protein